MEGVKTPLKLEVDVMVKMGVMKKLLSGVTRPSHKEPSHGPSVRFLEKPPSG